jgi:hypothetical protein
MSEIVHYIIFFLCIAGNAGVYARKVGMQRLLHKYIAESDDNQAGDERSCYNRQPANPTILVVTFSFELCGDCRIIGCKYDPKGQKAYLSNCAKYLFVTWAMIKNR